MLHPRRSVVVAAEPTVETQSKPTIGTAVVPPVKRPQESGALKGASAPPPPPPPRRPRPERSWFSIAAGQALDSVSDVLRHGRRSLIPLPSEGFSLDRLVPGEDGQLRLQVPKPVILVLGSGWGAHSLIKVIDTDTFDVVVVSPRNHFVFTPMLPSCAVGTVEFRSVLEPVRVSNPFVTYFEATVDALDLTQRTATCTSSVAYVDGRRPKFTVPYDVVVVSVGEQPATLGVPGVEEHAYFMKEVVDTVRLRQRINECFELASLPGTTEEDRRAALRFVVVGGGPTGVEFAGTLADFVRLDLKKRYPELMRFVSVQLLQSSQSILTQFDSSLQDVALDSLAKGGVQVRLGVRVAGITKTQITLSNGESFNYGVCVWSAGNAARPLVRSLVEQVPEQQAFQRAGAPPTTHKLAVDPYLRVIGARGALALGDCCNIVDEPLPATAQVAGQQGPYIAHLVNRGYGLGLGGLDEPPPQRPREALPEALLVLQALLTGGRPNAAKALADKRERARQNVAPKASAAAEAEPSTSNSSGAGEDVESATPFEFLSLGIMAYVGADSAVQQIEAGNLQRNLSGRFAYLLWRSVYITKQVSFRNRVLILFDWLKAQVFGRDISMF